MNIDDSFAVFAREGEDEVRKALAAGRYGIPRRYHAEEWLRRIDEAKETARQETALSLAERTTRATETQALMSKLALATSIVALLISIVALFLSRGGQP